MAARGDHRGVNVSTRPMAVTLTAGLVLLAAAPVSARVTWSQVPSPNRPGSNELLGAAAADESHVWAVGRVVNDSIPSSWRSLLLAWNGDSWAPVAHPHFSGNHLLHGVDARAADDAWAVGHREVASGGSRTVVEHWDGARWRVVPSPNPNARGLNQLLAVRAVPGEPDTVWAVGSYDNPETTYGDLTMILRRAAGTWGVVASPNVTADNHLEAVDAVGSSDAWAVGWGSTSQFGGTALAIVLRWNGTSWATAAIPEPSSVMLFGVEAVDVDDVWAVGHTYTGGPHWIPLVLHWDGVTWSRANIPVFQDGGQLRDVVALSATDVYAVGFAGEGTNAETLVLHWDGTAWTRQTTPSPGTGPMLYGAATAGTATVWAAGHRYEPSLFAFQTLTLRGDPVVAP
jgi:hypothetical protein